MKPVQVEIEDELLAVVDGAAARAQEARGAFILAALRAELKRRRDAEGEEAHRRSFTEQPEDDFGPPGTRAWGEE